MAEVQGELGWLYDQYETLPDSSSSPEELLCRATQWQELSTHAQYIVRLILKCPKHVEPLLKDFDNPILSKQEFFSVIKIKEHLKHNGWQWKTIISAIQEIRYFLSSL